MAAIWLALITGLTTGGLSCMAVQGGLLATTLAPDGKPTKARETARTISLFLLAKLVVYTLLGFLLGWLGASIELSATTRAVLQLFVAIFLIGTALRMLDVHPIFRVFAVQPPKALTRWLRRFSKESESDLGTPVILGALTVLIPCGVTQAMMATALSTASPWQGAAIMAAFTLGTMPVFFGLAYLATRLGQQLQRWFTVAAAILILFLGLYAVEGGLNLLGSPISVRAWLNNRATETEEPLPATQDPAAPAEYTIEVSGWGYSPANLTAPADRPLKLTFTSNESYSCANAIVFPSLDLQLYLEPTDSQTLEIPAQKPGTVRYTCAMGMYTGKITIK